MFDASSPLESNCSPYDGSSETACSNNMCCSAQHGRKAGPPQRNSCNLLNLPNLPNYLYMRWRERAGSSAWKSRRWNGQRESLLALDPAGGEESTEFPNCKLCWKGDSGIMGLGRGMVPILLKESSYLVTATGSVNDSWYQIWSLPGYWHDPGNKPRPLHIQEKSGSPDLLCL